MKAQAEPTSDNNLSANRQTRVPHAVAQKQGKHEPAFQFEDNRPEAVAQRKLQEVANNSSQARQTAHLQVLAGSKNIQLKKKEEEELVQKKENKTGLPDNLKTGIENLSGYSMDDVKVHRNSDKPAQLNAHAYAQGTDIHLASGQEKHLPHEAWHVVQQKQGRVKPTTQLKGKVNINDDEGLEKEADVMGAKALQQASLPTQLKFQNEVSGAVASAPIQTKLIPNKLNVVGENHTESDKLRKDEQNFGKDVLGSKNYWTEAQFRMGKEPMISFFTDSREIADPFELRILHSLNFLKSQIQKDDTYMTAVEWKNQLTIYCSNLKEGSDGNELDKERKKYYTNVLAKTFDSWKKKEDDIVIKEIDQLLPQLAPFVAENRGIKADKLESDKGVSCERSLAMHNAANKEAASKSGLWKVGDSHAKDMSKLEDREYELTTERDFQSYLKLYLTTPGKENVKSSAVLAQQDEDIRKELIDDLTSLIGQVYYEGAEADAVIHAIKTRVKEKVVAEAILKSKDWERAQDYVTKKEKAEKEEAQLSSLELEVKEFEKKQTKEDDTDEKRREKGQLERRNEEIDLLKSILGTLMKEMDSFVVKAKKLTGEPELEDKYAAEAQEKRIASGIYSGLSSVIPLIEEANKQVVSAGYPKISINFLMVWEDLTKPIPKLEAVNKDAPWDAIENIEKLYDMLKKSPASIEKQNITDDVILTEVLKNSKAAKNLNNWRRNESTRKYDMKYGFDRIKLAELEKFLLSMKA
ncbi:DUF4157 domain-containing protein [Marivirga sp. S37H4]|uniref:DUF4157 domain-containing protein n=1 Tax=Marivirga aurantiaca TaxID=2802615 RepID=A0A934WYE2_9BACT|nr:DUF4157 domain-containing protein [Marivirga aurantiaca]MBK6265110.1 DUF4157 domain-containing protein [Marivirga aurantiaca]